MRLDERALEQAKEQREKEEQQKAAAKAKPYQVQQFPLAFQVSQHAMCWASDVCRQFPEHLLIYFAFVSQETLVVPPISLQTNALHAWTQTVWAMPMQQKAAPVQFRNLPHHE